PSCSVSPRDRANRAQHSPRRARIAGVSLPARRRGIGILPLKAPVTPAETARVRWRSGRRWAGTGTAAPTQRDRRKLLERAIDSGVLLGIGSCHAEDDRFDGRHVRVHGRVLVNFASCSYLGLELDSRLIEAAVDATRRFGIETSSSRAYLSAPLYTEFESLIEQVFGGAHVVVAPTTTLGHLAALPALIDDDDAVILDHQVHASVQMAAKLL